MEGRTPSASRARRTAISLAPPSRAASCLSEKPACLMAPVTPAAGPDSSADPALLRIAVAGTRPPFDCIIEKVPPNPSLARRASMRVR